MKDSHKGNVQISTTDPDTGEHIIIGEDEMDIEYEEITMIIQRSQFLLQKSRWQTDRQAVLTVLPYLPPGTPMWR